jgi:hypothetical protein
MKKKILYSVSFFFFFSFCFFSCKDDDVDNNGSLQLARVSIGTTTLAIQDTALDVAIDNDIVIEFSNTIDTSTVRNNILLIKKDSANLAMSVIFSDENKTIILRLSKPLVHFANYTLQIKSGLKGIYGENFPGLEYNFRTINGNLKITSITLNGLIFSSSSRLQNVDYKNINIEVGFSDALDASAYQQYFSMSGGNAILFSLSSDRKKLNITNQGNLNDLTKYVFAISNNLKSANGYVFDGFSNSFYTAVDSTYKFSLISDEELLGLIQQQTFKYFWDFAHPDCGLSRERNTSGDVVTIGGSGFGVMALIVGMERGFITRTEGLDRLDKIVNFLETCDRYHGAWPHWLNGSTGATVPFSQNDDGGDLVETSFMIQGLLTMRQYLDTTISAEKDLAHRIMQLSNSVEYDWFTRDENVLYWHWSPNNGWAVNVKIEGYNETLITYVLAASSVSHPVSSDVYKLGYTRNGNFVNGKTFYGYYLPLGQDYGGPLFFTHYSFLGLDPRNLADSYANYWEQNVNQSLINYSYCVANPLSYVGYSGDCWGLTASDIPNGYSASSPTNDLGVVAPTAAISALPYTPVQSMAAIRYYYYILGDKLWGEYGFYDAFNITQGWWADSYIAIDQGPIICMIENYRTGLLWNLFMSNQEVENGLDKLGFTY